jgi:TPR repeat protein
MRSMGSGWTVLSAGLALLAASPVWADGDSDLFLRASLDRDEVLVGEQTTLSLYLYSRVELSSVDDITLPKLEDFWSEEVERPTVLSGEQRTVNGISYRAYLLRRQALFPAKAGTLTITSVEADITTGFLFNGHQVHRVSNELEVKVKPLPPGAPPGFASANVGSWKLSMEVSPASMELGQPFTVRVILDGLGNVTNVTPPKLTAPEGFKVFEPITRNELPPVQKQGLLGRRMQEYMVVPLRAGTFTLPAMEFPSFDLHRRMYDVARTEPVTVTVKGGAGGVAALSSTPPSTKSEGGMEDPAPASPSTLQEACDRGEVRSCSLLGELYEEGRGVPRDNRRAASLYEKACTGKVAQGCHYLGLRYAAGEGVPRDERRAAALFEQACKAGAAPSCLDLGTRYQDGSGVPKNLRRAATLFGKACAGGHHQGCVLLGQLHKEGLGVPKNERRAAAFYEKACTGGWLPGCSELGWLYAKGRGVPKDERRASMLFGKACVGGSAYGCSILSWRYQKGQGVPQNDLYAAVLSHEACEGGESAECNNLGVVYSSGRGVPKDERRAAALYEKACEGGAAHGCHNLGVLYGEGRGVPKDERRAAVLFEKACKAGLSTDCAGR